MKGYHRFESKYKNNWTECKQGHKHQSGIEARYCDQLKLEQKAGLIDSYDTQKSFDFWIEDHFICSHKVDFIIYKMNHETNEIDMEVHEVKGKELADWEIKKKLFEAIYKDIPYIVIKKV